MLLIVFNTSLCFALARLSSVAYFLNSSSAIGIVTSSLDWAERMVAISVCHASDHFSPASLFWLSPNFFSALLKISRKSFFLSIQLLHGRKYKNLTDAK